MMTCLSAMVATACSILRGDGSARCGRLAADIAALEARRCGDTAGNDHADLGRPRGLCACCEQIVRASPPITGAIGSKTAGLWMPLRHAHAPAPRDQPGGGQSCLGRTAGPPCACTTSSCGRSCTA